MWYHFVGTKQEEDIAIFSDDKNPKWMCGASVADGKMDIIFIFDILYF